MKTKLDLLIEHLLNSFLLRQQLLLSFQHHRLVLLRVSLALPLLSRFGVPSLTAKAASGATAASGSCLLLLKQTLVSHLLFTRCQLDFVSVRANHSHGLVAELLQEGFHLLINCS